MVIEATMARMALRRKSVDVGGRYRPRLRRTQNRQATGAAVRAVREAMAARAERAAMGAAEVETWAKMRRRQYRYCSAMAMLTLPLDLSDAKT